MPRRALFVAPQYDGSFANPLPGSAGVESALRDVLEARGGYEFKAVRRTVRRPEFLREVRDLADTTGEVLLYFYGHGILRGLAGVFVTSDGEADDEGVGMREIIEIAFLSRAREVVIILDCCHAGAAIPVTSDAIDAGANRSLRPGRILLAGCATHQQGWVETTESKQMGVFSWHVLAGLNGAARSPSSSDVRGSTLGVYLTDTFRAWNQSPLFLHRETGDQRCVITSGFEIKEPESRRSAATSDGVQRTLVLGVPFRPSQLFVGREAEIQTLRTLLTGGQRPVAVSATVEGLGGVGKTELVIQLLEEPEILDAFSTIVWLDGAGPLATQWQKYGEALNLELSAAEPATLIERISSAMTQRGRTLIVLDNAADWRPVEHLIPTTASVLVTTRTRDFGGTSFRHLELDILSDDSAKSLLVQLVPRVESDESLPKLIAALGGHALALEIAAGTIRTLAISAAEYLARLDTRSPDPTEVLNQVKHGKTVEECLRLTWDTLQRESARLLWRRASLFAPTSAHRDLLRVSFSPDPKTRRELEHLLRDQTLTSDIEPGDILSDEFDVAYAELRSRNVFSRIEGASGERWAIHRLVRDFGRARIRPLEFLAHSMAVSEWLRAPNLDLLPEIPHVIAIILDSAKFGGEFQSVLGRSRNIGRELGYRSVWSSDFFESSEYFLQFIRDELRDPKALTMLLEGLTDVNDDVRKQAIRVLERLPAVPEIIDGIAAALDDPDSGVRSLARRTITESGTARVVNILERTLSSSRPRARVEAVRGLAELGPNGREALETAFAAQTGDVKFEAALALAELGSDVVLTDLIPIAQTSTDPTVRMRALRAVRFAPSEAVDALYMTAISDPHRPVGVQVLRALENYPRIDVVKECVTRYFASALPTLPSDEGLELSLSLATQHEIALSGEVGQALATHHSWTVRQKISRILAWSTAPNVSQLLAKLLGDSDYDVREAAVRSITTRRDSSLLPQLIAIAASDSNAAVKKAAAEGSRAIQESSGTRRRKSMESVDERIATALAMGETRSPDDVPFLIRQTKAKSPALREAVVRSLGRIRSADADKTLADLIQNDRNEAVRQAAAVALLRVRCPVGKDTGEDCATAAVLTDQKFMNPTEIAEAIMGADQESLCPIMVRSMAKSLAMGASTEQSAKAKELVKAFVEYDDWETRVYAITALAKIGGKDASEALVKLLDDTSGDVRREAAKALGLVGGVAAKDRLQSSADNDDDLDVRKVARESVCRLTSAHAK